jgi:zinc transporter 1/2/3
MSHIFPEAVDALVPPCGSGGANGGRSPYVGLVAICFAMATMMVDSVVTGKSDPIFAWATAHWVKCESW